MTLLAYDVLSFLSRHVSCRWTDALNAFDPAHKVREVDSALRELLSLGFAELVWPVQTPPNCEIRITQPGRIACRTERERRGKQALIQQRHISDEQAKQEQHRREIEDERAARRAERRADRIAQIPTIIITAAASAFFTNFDRLIPWFAAFFRRLFG